ncbi:MAG TPA: hypothetical protein VLI65_10600, partial [Pyrinomonadaceae bacterium]|nr:hypothetical protein [Pyrinomonadaceae bacterium]
MKRIKELTIFTLAMLFIAAFFSEYAVTASAPSVRAVLVPAAEPAQMSARGSFVDQVIKSTMSLFKSEPTVSAVDRPLINTIKDAQPMSLPAAQPDLMLTPEPAQPVTFEPIASKPAPDGNYCDPNFVGSPISFAQTSQLRLDDLLDQIHSRFGINFLMGPG